MPKFTAEEVLSIMTTAVFNHIKEENEKDKAATKNIEDAMLNQLCDEIRESVLEDFGEYFARSLARPRAFEIAKGFEKENVKLPTRSTVMSAGYDFCSLDNITIQPNATAVIRTGVKVRMPSNNVLLIYPRSSMSIKKKLRMANSTAVIDADYYNNQKNDGHILICLHNFGYRPQEIKVGDRIAQGVFMEYLTCGDLPDGSRGGGIGSTGR